MHNDWILSITLSLKEENGETGVVELLCRNQSVYYGKVRKIPAEELRWQRDVVKKVLICCKYNFIYIRKQLLPRI